jgi:hypothetical protein
MKFFFPIFAALVLALPAQGQEKIGENDTWYKVFETEKTVFFAKYGSMETEYDSYRKNVVFGVFRSQDKAKNIIEFYKFKLPVSDCSKGYGTITAMTLDDVLLHRWGYVKDGGNYASYIAQALCDALRARDSAEQAAAAEDAAAQKSP